MDARSANYYSRAKIRPLGGEASERPVEKSSGWRMSKIFDPIALRKILTGPPREQFSPNYIDDGVVF
jgi:hypothetical protein